MIGRALVVTAIAGTCAVAVACSRPARPSTDTPALALVRPTGAPAFVQVSGLSGTTLDALRAAALTSEQWSTLLRVAVADDGPAMLGQYEIAGDSLRFIPAFAFEPGRTYKVQFDPSRVPGRSGGGALIRADVGVAARTRAPTTVVEHVYPSGGEVPANLLRIYIEFSAPMSRGQAHEHVQLLDDRGREISGAFLPLDYELWTSDSRRLTVLFDPGRVKKGILPNEQMGRALVAGRRYTLRISSDWRDADGEPLAHEYRHQFRAGPEREGALAPASWQVTAPAAGGREPLTITFPTPLDQGLLMRALGVRSGDTAVPGEARTENGETRWVFTPERPWTAGAYSLLALSILEDPAGNRIGRAFEIVNRESVDKGPEAQAAMIPFTVRQRGTD